MANQNNDKVCPGTKIRPGTKKKKLLKREGDKIKFVLK